VRLSDVDAAHAVVAPLIAAESFPSSLKMRVDAHYMFCKAGALPPCPPLGSFAVSGPSADPIVMYPASAQAGTALGFTATPNSLISMSASDISFFQSLGSATPKSTFRSVIAEPGTTLGVDHAVAGDVNNDGCVDRADFAIMSQPGVMNQRALPPNQPNIQADLNRDGWVNLVDQGILLANLGRGCIKPGQVPNPIPAGKLNLEVRNVDNADSCTYGSFRPEFKITNWGSTAYPLNAVDIRMAFNNPFEQAIEFVVADNVVVFNANGGITGGYGKVTPLETAPAPASCVVAADRGATQTQHALLGPITAGTNVTIPPNGGYATVIVQYRRAGGLTPFDAGCDDFSRLPADPLRAFHSDKYFSLVKPVVAAPPTALVCEYKTSSTVDTSSGIDSGVITCGINACP
jgi:hypothetical protein